MRSLDEADCRASASPRTSRRRLWRFSGCLDDRVSGVLVGIDGDVPVVGEGAARDSLTTGLTGSTLRTSQATVYSIPSFGPAPAPVDTR